PGAQDTAVLEPAVQLRAGVHGQGRTTGRRRRHGARIQGDPGRQARRRVRGQLLHEGRDGRSRREAGLSVAATLQLEIVTPEAVVVSRGVSMVTLPAVDGQVGIYPRHVPLLTRIVPGEAIVQRNGTTEFLALGEGIVEVTGDRVAIVTDMAVAARDIDEARAEEARRRAAARLRDKISDEEVATVNASLAR